MALIQMTHPDLPGQTGEIDEEGFPEFAAKGWRRVDAPTTDAEAPRTKTARRPAAATTEEKE